MAIEIPDKAGGRTCRVTLKRLLWAIRFATAMSTSTSLRVRPKLMWARTKRCETAVYRHYWDKGEDWEP